jgi:putative tryptophan/tyrosine transport system substrate-binding protein
MQFDRLRRREFIALLGGMALAWPFEARAQQAAMPVVGFLNSTSLATASNHLSGFRQGLQQAGYVEGRNLAVEYRWAEGRYDRLPTFAADLVSRRVDVIVAGGPPAARAAKAATGSIPVVFTSGDDPVHIGLVRSLNRPSGNLTGVHLFLTGLSAKKLGLLHDLLPAVSVIAAIVNPSSQNAEVQTKDLQAAGHALGLQIEIADAGSEQEIAAAFDKFRDKRVGALIVGSDPAYMARRDQIITLTNRYAIPAVYELREFVDAGGLMSYGPSIIEGYRLAGVYAGRIIKGEKPADLPVVQVTKFEMVINLRTAKTLGITISDNLLSLADEVIE